MRYAGATRRLLAFLMDCIVLIGLYVLIGFVLGLAIFFQPLSTLPMFGFWWYGGLFFVSWLYFAGFESSQRQATLGKQILRLKVVDIKGRPISFGRASLRYFSKILSRILLCLGFVMILFTKKKQGLHDKLASTFIIVK